MADPLSITTGVITLLGTCITVVTAVKDFCDGAAIVNVKVTGLVSDVESFTQVLELTKNTLEQEKVRNSLQTTGHIGNHWTNLSKSINDGQNTLIKLQATLNRVNKSVGTLDKARKHLRLKGALDEIAMFQQQIRSCRDTIQLSLQTVILWNQVNFKESNDKIMPNLDELHESIRRIALDINAQMTTLQALVESNAKTEQMEMLVNLRNCVQSAASVVSSASTTLGIDPMDNTSITYGSEFGDCFPPQPSETMMRWVSSSTVYNFDEYSPQNKVGQTLKRSSGETVEENRGQSDTETSDHSDSDNELEMTKVEALLRQGHEKLNLEDFEAAERLFRNCLARTAFSLSPSSTNRTSKLGVMDLVIDTCMRQAKWSEAQSLLLEKISLRSRRSDGDDSDILSDVVALAHAFLNQRAYSEALLYARRAYKGYTRMGGEPGTKGMITALHLLVNISHNDGNLDEEEAYTAILSNFTPVSSMISERSTTNAADSTASLTIVSPAGSRRKPLLETQSGKQHPFSPVSRFTEDEFGKFLFKWEHPAQNDVFVTGTFDNWSKSRELIRSGDVFMREVALPKEKVYYKFVVDGYWTLNPTAPQEYDEQGTLHNVVTIDQIKNIKRHSPSISGIAATAPATFAAEILQGEASENQLPKRLALTSMADSVTRGASELTDGVAVEVRDPERREESDRYQKTSIPRKPIDDSQHVNTEGFAEEERTGVRMLGVQGPGLLTSPYLTKRPFWFQSKPVDICKYFSAYVNSGEEPEVARHNVSWASETGKGLLFFRKDPQVAGRETVTGVINLSDAAAITRAKSCDFSFFVRGSKHVFRAVSASQRADWVSTLTVKILEAQNMKSYVIETANYKRTFLKLSDQNKGEDGADKSLTVDDTFATSNTRDRWLQIRKNADERAAAAEKRSEEHQSESQKPDDVDGEISSGEESIERRVARIKARVAELTGKTESAPRRY